MSARARGRWPGAAAAALSLALHGAFAAAVWCWPGGGSHDRRPVPIDTATFEPDGGLHLSLAEVPRPAAKPSARDPRDDQPPETVPARIADLQPLATEAPAAPPAPPAAPSAVSRPGGPGGGQGNGGGPSFFQLAARGQSVVYVIDRSSSMGINGGLAAARQELLASLERLPETSRFQVILYNRAAEPMAIGGQTGLTPATAAARAEAAARLGAVRAEGSTDHLAALRRALMLRPDVIFFVTDADDLTPLQVRTVTEWNRAVSGGRTAIHAIDLGGETAGREPRPLELPARWNGGAWQAPDLGRLSRGGR